MADIDDSWTERLLPELDPPPGGVLRLRARLDARVRQRLRVAWVPVGLAAAAGATLAVRGFAPDPMADPALFVGDAGVPALIGPASAPVSLLPDASDAVLEPVATSGDLVWYRVAGVRRVPEPR